MPALRLVPAAAADRAHASASAGSRTGGWTRTSETTIRGTWCSRPAQDREVEHPEHQLHGVVGSLVDTSDLGAVDGEGERPRPPVDGIPVVLGDVEVERDGRELLLQTRIPEPVHGGQVRLVRDTSDRDTYGRLLAYVVADGQDVNRALVRGGFAIARSYPPDTARDDQLATAEQEARRDGAGMWGPDGCGSDVDADGIALSVQADAPGDDSANLNGEWLAIGNTGDAPLDLSGWGVKDESASHRYTFPDGTTVAPGATLRLLTGCGEDTADVRHWCAGGSAVWNNDGDTAFLLDPDGRTVTSLSY